MWPIPIVTYFIFSILSFLLLVHVRVAADDVEIMVDRGKDNTNRLPDEQRAAGRRLGAGDC